MTARIPVCYYGELKPEWIDYTLEQFARSTDAEGLKSALRQRLSSEISGATYLRKIVSQLEQTAGYKSQLSREQLLKFYEEMSHLPPDQRNPVRLRLLVKSSKFVADCLSAIRKLHRLGVDGVECKQLYERLESLYGVRGTIPRRVRYVLKTLANLGVLENREKKWFVIVEV